MAANEIAKALSLGAQVLIMDEPTSSLTKTETQHLLEFIRRLEARGLWVIYIFHSKEEVFDIADRVTVLRDGRVVGTDEVASVSMTQVIEHIVGRKLEHAFEWAGERSTAAGGHQSCGRRARLRSELSLARRRDPGLAGLLGSGRTELAQALFGIRPITSGTVDVRGQRVAIDNPRSAEGLVLQHNVQDNLVLYRGADCPP